MGRQLGLIGNEDVGATDAIPRTDMESAATTSSLLLAEKKKLRERIELTDDFISLVNANNSAAPATSKAANSNATLNQIGDSKVDAPKHWNGNNQASGHRNKERRAYKATAKKKIQKGESYKERHAEKLQNAITKKVAFNKLKA